MSTPMVVAIYNRAVGIEVLTDDPGVAQADLISVLAKDPETEVGGDPTTQKAAVRFANKGDSVLYPEITFRDAAGNFDQRFGAGMLVQNGIFAVEFWDNSPDNTVISNMIGYWERMFDNRVYAPPLVLSTGYSYWFECQVPPLIQYDSIKHVWFALSLWRAVEGRAWQ